MRCFARLAALLLGIAPCLAAPQAASAVIISVPGTATGGFGAPNNAFTNMVLGKVVVIADPVYSETVRISATGLIDIGLGPTVPPAGISLGLTASPGEVIPLEEAFIDGGGSLPARTVTNIGAVMAVFVPALVANNGLFVPRDEDLTALGIDADLLFYVGPGPLDITVTESGTFYVGVNDSYALNNSLAFSVTLDTVAQASVPEPSSSILVGIGLIGMGCRLRRRREIRR